MWACEHDGVTPDLMTVGKGIGGGLPLAAVLGTGDVMSTWTSDATTSTFLTNALNERSRPVAAIDVLRDEGLVERSAELGERRARALRAGLAGNPRVGDVARPRPVRRHRAGAGGQRRARPDGARPARCGSSATAADRRPPAGATATC